MKFVLQVGAQALLLSAAQMETLVETIAGCERIQADYTADGKGGYHYVHTIVPLDMREKLVVNVMDDIEYASMKFTTMQLAEAKNQATK